jgi:hypothetical protein
MTVPDGRATITASLRGLMMDPSLPAPAQAQPHWQPLPLSVVANGLQSIQGFTQLCNRLSGICRRQHAIGICRGRGGHYGGYDTMFANHLGSVTFNMYRLGLGLG